MRLDNPAFYEKNAATSKSPRYIVEIAFDQANTDLSYFTSHDDIVTLDPAKTIANVIGHKGISGTSQQIDPDYGRATIGNINASLIDYLSQISTLFNTKLDIGLGLKGKRVRVSLGFEDLALSDYVLVQTQIVDSVAFDKGSYVIKCADVQRSERKEIFKLTSTTLSQSIDSVQLLIPVYSVANFELMQHGTSFTDAPSQTVLYIKIEKEIIRCTGTTTDPILGLVFSVDTNGRGVLNTAAAAHIVDTTITDNSRKTKVEEFVYLEMPVAKLIYAILTGDLEGQPGQKIPLSWHLNIDPSYVRLSDFTGIGVDLWDPSDDTQGRISVFKGLKKQDAKKFIETELNLLLACYNPIYSDGSLGLKRMTSILAGASYVVKLNEKNVVSYGSLLHDMRAIRNIYQVEWNYDHNTNKFTRSSLLIDTESIAPDKNGEAVIKIIKFKGLSGDRHTSQTIYDIFNSLRDRYSNPPLKLKLEVLPSLNVLEVGDIVNVDLKNIRDYNGSLAPLNRSFEIQKASINWITGNVSLDLFASSQAASTLGLAVSATSLNDSFYISAGIELKTYIDSNYPGSFTIIGGVGHIIGDVILPGLTPSAIYYYDNPLTIDSGVIVKVTNNIQLRVKGFLTINGTIDGKGAGLLGVVSNGEYPPNTTGTPGYFGITEAGGGVSLPNAAGFVSSKARITNGLVSSLSHFTLAYSKTTDVLSGIPSSLLGSSGGPGGNITRYNNAGTQIGGNGGNGGAGLITISRGSSLGASGSVNLSGDDGLLGQTINPPAAAEDIGTGTGSGGSSGCWLALIDGVGSTLPDIAKFTANHGKTDIRPGYVPFSSSFVAKVPSSTKVVSFYTGLGNYDQRTSAFRVQFIPEDVTAAPDPSDQIVIPPSSLVLSSGDSELFANPDGTIVSRLKVSWIASVDQLIGGYDVEYKFSTEIIWMPASNTVNLEINSIHIAPINDGAQYDVRVRAINNIGSKSDWIIISNYTVIGKLAPPPDCNSLTVKRQSDGTRVFDGGLLISNRPSDFAGYVLRAGIGFDLPWASMQPLNKGLITQLPFETNQLAAGNYTAGIKAIDTTGNESVNAIKVNSTLGDPRIKNVIYDADYDENGWPGTKTNAWVDKTTNKLIARDQLDWSSLGLWRDWITWARNPFLTIIYESATVDLGAILTFTPLISVSSNGDTTLTEESHSDDNITFTPFANSGTSVQARYLKTKITITKASGLIVVTQGGLIVDSSIVEEYLNDIDTSLLTGANRIGVGDIRIPITENYAVIKSVFIALQNVGGGWTWEIIDKDVTVGPRIKIYNASNVLADALIDANTIGA